jgi:hypothetical protein
MAVISILLPRLDYHTTVKRGSKGSKGDRRHYQRHDQQVAEKRLSAADKRRWFRDFSQTRSVSATVMERTTVEPGRQFSPSFYWSGSQIMPSAQNVNRAASWMTRVIGSLIPPLVLPVEVTWPNRALVMLVDGGQWGLPES